LHFLSCLIISVLLRRVNSRLAAAARQRRSAGSLGDAGCGSRPALLAYFDDQTAFLPYSDLPLTTYAFLDLAPPLGIILNQTHNHHNRRTRTTIHILYG
jgi:hypothetical protein